MAIRLTLCTRCGAPTANRPSTCDRCRAGHSALQRERNAAYDRLRDPHSVQFYHSSAWKTLRLTKLISAGYLCEECLAEAAAGLRRTDEIRVATDVHHIRPLAEAWELRLVWSNLQALCDGHHQAKRRKS